MPANRRTPPPPPLWERLVLFHYLTRQLGFESFDGMAAILRALPPEDKDDGSSRYCQALCAALPPEAAVEREFIEQADANIRRHTAHIGRRRAGGLQWKYFQWLILLFAEIYLDRYWRGREKLLRDLEEHRLAYFAGRSLAGGYTSAYRPDDLRKLSLWSATGSGKTLLLHANLLQFWHYRDKAGARGDFNRTILLVTNDGLAEQHLGELALSGINAARFEKTAPLLRGATVEIVSVHQLAEKSGEKTVAVDLFESNNLVLVDEGHRGTKGDKWLAMRDRLCRDGFSFEYSATFGQMTEKHLAEYAKNIFFDYSYHRFYNDGYGKEYRIFNLRDGAGRAAVTPDNKRRYLVAGLLAYYRQRRMFEDNPEIVRQFMLERPLWVFVGSKVNAVRREKGKAVSDVLDVLRFLREFAADRKTAEKDIEAVLRDRELFNFRGFFDGWGMRPGAEIYKDVLSLVFNCRGGGAFLASRVEGADGEIALTLGGKLFGLVNIGDVPGFMKLCAAQLPEIVKDAQNFSESLFRGVNAAGSEVNVLVGAKKFTEGWNSWRVSAMGLMNVGKSEGAEILQMFGRGVRLRGFGGGLRRRAFAPGAPDKPDADTLEELCVFGVKANFMDTFRDYLKYERMEEKEEIRINAVPVIRALEKENLKIIRARPKGDFKSDAPPVVVPPPGSPGSPPRKVFLDWRPRLDAMTPQDETAAAPARARRSIPDDIKPFLNQNRIYAMLQEFKADKGWHNLALPRAVVQTLLDREMWYELSIAQSDDRFDTFAVVRNWEEIAAELMKKYLQACCLAAWAEWEKESRRFETLTVKHPNFIGEYRAEVEKSQKDLIAKLKGINEAVRRGVIAPFAAAGGYVYPEVFDRHLYRPLLHISGGCKIEIRPRDALLNEGERRFVLKLQKFFKNTPEFFANRKLYLLRNLSRGRGAGFMEANNFYPDFLLWLLDDGLQHIAFIDPKGLVHIRAGDPKVGFYKTVVDEVEKPMRKNNGENIRLHAFLVSQTPMEQMLWETPKTREGFAEKNILFADDEEHIEQMLNKIISRR